MNLTNFGLKFGIAKELIESFKSKWNTLSFDDIKDNLPKMTQEDWNEFKEKCGNEAAEVVDAWHQGKESLLISWNELKEVMAINERILTVRVDKLDMPTVVKYSKENMIKDARGVALIVGKKQESDNCQKVFLAFLDQNDELIDSSKNIYIVFCCQEIDQEILNSVDNNNIVILK